MRRTPLTRRTPLARGGTLARRTRIRQVSDRRRRRDSTYPSSRRQVYERANGMCEAQVGGGVCEGPGWQVHHLAGRGGPDPHRLENLLLTCAPCHRWIHAHPEAAYAVGLMVRRLVGGHRQEDTDG